mgnify:CR=1 FL=1
MEFKSLELLEKQIEEYYSEKAVNKKNSKGVSHAQSLIDNNSIIRPENWVAPTVEEQNAYIEKNGWSEYSKWFLGVDTSEDSETKGHYGYIYTSDFKNVDREGLRAIRQRSAQRGLTSVFAAAGKLMMQVDEDKND